MRNGALLLRLYRWIDDRLARAGQHTRTPWWDATIQRACLHPTANRFLAEVGRGGVKSMSARHFAVAVMLAGIWTFRLVSATISLG